MRGMMTGVANKFKSGPSLTANYNSFSFDGIDDSISLGDNLDIGTSDYSGSIWFKTTSSSSQILQSKSSGGVSFFHAYLLVSSLLDVSCVVDNSNKRIFRVTDAGMFDGGWHNFIYFVDRSAGTCTTFLDAVSVSNSSVSPVGSITGDISTTADFMVGDRSSGGLPMDGDLTQSIFSIGGDLTQFATEIYNNGKPLLYSLLPSGVTSIASNALAMSSADNTLVDESTGGLNGTANGGVTSDGSTIEWQIV